MSGNLWMFSDMLTVVTKKVKTGTVNGVTQYRYETAEKTYYLQDEAHTSEQLVEIDAFKSVEVTLPVYSGGTITGTKTETYYQANGRETVSPTTETIKYVECTIHPFDNTVIATAFGIDLNAPYEQFGITYGEAGLLPVRHSPLTSRPTWTCRTNISSSTCLS